MLTERVVEISRRGAVSRILAYGSSNTERRVSGMHWFDCVDLALKQRVGRVHRCINCGIGGDTAGGLLERFAVDAAFYKPQVVFITIGGNDSAPDRKLAPSKFEGELRELHRRFAELDCKVIFQTYYAADSATLDPTHFRRFHDFMDIVRQVAADTGADLMDHLAHWEPFRLAHPEEYATLMLDALHVNYQGNMVMGLDLARKFGLELGEDDPGFWTRAREVQAMMDGCS